MEVSPTLIELLLGLHLPNKVLSHKERRLSPRGLYLTLYHNVIDEMVYFSLTRCLRRSLAHRERSMWRPQDWQFAGVRTPRLRGACTPCRSSWGGRCIVLHSLCCPLRHNPCDGCIDRANRFVFRLDILWPEYDCSKGTYTLGLWLWYRSK